jgi:hypothetical protein
MSFIWEGRYIPGRDTTGFDKFPVVTDKDLRNMIPSLVGRTVLWTDDRIRYEPDKLVSIGGGALLTKQGSQHILGYAPHIIQYEGKRYLWWSGGVYVMIEIGYEDKCGKCISTCRSEDGKCPLYQEE